MYWSWRVALNLDKDKSLPVVGSRLNKCISVEPEFSGKRFMFETWKFQAILLSILDERVSVSDIRKSLDTGVSFKRVDLSRVRILQRAVVVWLKNNQLQQCYHVIFLVVALLFYY